MSGGVEVADGTTPRYSSSPELSSPPRSISEPGSPAAAATATAQLTAEHRNAQNNTITVNYGVDDRKLIKSFLGFLDYFDVPL